MNKKNTKYWEHRKAEMMHSQIARADVTFDEISKVYNHSRKHIEKSVKGIFNKFQAEYGLSKKEIKKIQTYLDKNDRITDNIEFQKLVNKKTYEELKDLINYGGKK